MPEVHLGEWDRQDPSSSPALRGRTLDDPGVRPVAELLERWGALRVEDGRTGLVVRTRQHVGVVQLGELRIRVRPKVRTETLWRLMAYGLGLDDLPRHPPVQMALDGSYPDLLASMLWIEAERLWSRGLSHGYVQREAWLDTPRGRPDLATLSRNLPLTRPALPCRFHAFTADTLDNRVVLSGLRLAGRLVDGRRLRAVLHRAVETWRGVCEPVGLDRATLDAVDRARTRLTERYAPAHRLVRALVERAGPDDRLRTGDATLPGALWNMATLFERAVARFLGEHLPPDHHVDTQHRLPHVYSVVRGGHGHRAPDPRPDLVVSRGGRVHAILDTKYRDLSATSLPREILYQMSVYGLAFGSGDVPAIVLYAVPSGERTDVVLRLHVASGADRTIVLRAVPLDRLVAVLGDRRAAAEEAQRLVAADGASASAGPTSRRLPAGSAPRR